MTFPMALQQAASINYDAVLLPLCFLYVAYIFYMRYTKERLGWKDVACTLLLLFLIFYIKIPYIFLGLLVFLLPKEKIHLKLGAVEIDGEFIRKWRIPVGIVLIVAGCAVVYMLRDNFWVRLVLGMTLEWKRSIYLFAATGHTWWKYLMTSSVGQFGWLDSALPFSFVLITYLLMLGIAVCGENQEQSMRVERGTRVFIWIVFIILAAFTVMSMVNHTIKVTYFGSEDAAVDYNIREMLYGIPYVGGLQGRYFLPFLVLPFLTLPQKGRKLKWKTWILPVYQVLAFVITLVVLYKRYWIG